MPAPGEHHLNILTRPEPTRSNERVGEVKNLDRLAHVEHVKVSRRKADRADYEGGSLARGHHVPRHTRVGDRDWAALLDLAFENRRYASPAADHIAEPDGSTLHSSLMDQHD